MGIIDTEQIKDLYNQKYANEYEANFLTSPLNASNTKHEIELIRMLLHPQSRWLDVACGTGFYLSQFPKCRREGLDLSPSMLDLARQANPGVTFHEASDVIDRQEWAGAWDLISCMWYAYGLVSSMDELEKLIGNLAQWTSTTGVCFVPIADPRLITGFPLNYVQPNPRPGQITIDGIIWSYSEENGAQVHRHQLAPCVDWMKKAFAKYFTNVRLDTYPPVGPQGACRLAILASGKRS